MSGGSKQVADLSLSPAECAKRTGLTVRALRVYERYGLVAAKRGRHSWRYYGLPELERLNTITALKSLGMTLAQIRELVRAKDPSLERVLEMQVRTWKAKKLESERALFLAQWALKRVQDRQALSISDMCSLIRGLEFDDHAVLIYSLLNEALTKDEYAAAMDFLKRHFDLSLIKTQLQQEAAIFRELRRLMETGVPPTAAEVQQLLARRNKAVSQYGGPERALKMIEWNPSIGIKFFSIEARTQKKMRSQPDAEHDPRVIVTPKVWEYFQQAYTNAPWTRHIVKIVADAQSLLETNPDATSTEAKELLKRFRKIYSKYSLGDPEVNLRLVPYWEAIHDGWPEWAGEENRAAWLFLSEIAVKDMNAVSQG